MKDPTPDSRARVNEYLNPRLWALSFPLLDGELTDALEAIACPGIFCPLASRQALNWQYVCFHFERNMGLKKNFSGIVVTKAKLHQLLTNF